MQILDILKNHNLWLKVEEWKFLRTKVEYLGLITSDNRIQMDSSEVKIVADWPAPRNVKNLEQFIGFINIYQTIVVSVLSTTQPLHNLKKASSPFVWKNM